MSGDKSTIKKQRRLIHLKYLWRAYLFRLLESDAKFVTSSQPRRAGRTAPTVLDAAFKDNALQELKAGSWDLSEHSLADDKQRTKQVIAFLKPFNNFLFTKKLFMPPTVSLPNHILSEDRSEVEKSWETTTDLKREFEAPDLAEPATAPSQEETQVQQQIPSTEATDGDEYYKFGWKTEECWKHLGGVRLTNDIHTKNLFGFEDHMYYQLWNASVFPEHGDKQVPALRGLQNSRSVVSLCLVDPPFGIYKDCDEPLSRNDLRQLWRMCDHLGNSHCVIISHCANVANSDASLHEQREAMLWAMDKRDQRNSDKQPVCKLFATLLACD